MTVPEKLSALRACMKSEGIDAWLVPTDDFHGSEYVGGYFKCREFLTGFTGSAGTALVTVDGAYLWTDGRYFLQAAQQLEGTGVTLMKIDAEGVPTIGEYLEENLKQGQVLGFDGRCMKAAAAKDLFRKLESRGIAWKVRAGGKPLDLVGRIWKQRPPLSCEPVWELDVCWAGKSRGEKLQMLREAMEKESCGYHLITSLDDIAWLLNLRGDDIPCNPVFLSCLFVTQDRALLFAQEKAFGNDVKSSLERDGIILESYEAVWEGACAVPGHARILLDPSSVNVTLWESLGYAERIEKPNPTILMKAVKNPVEMRHMAEAHIKDGIAMCRFIFWLKQRMRQYDSAHPVTELDVVEKLLEFRKEGEHFLNPSFETIAAYGPHGAIIHYSPTEETNIALEQKGFLLLDSGGQYLEGTTDITRTIACGPLTDEEKEYYTRVLRGNLNLGAAVFRHGCSGMALDYLARQPLWEMGKDYNHGTGHGVGYLLNVHENPNSIGYKLMQNRPLPCVLEEGMVTSNEPGFYVEGKFGVRCENLTLCVKGEKNDYGQFMRFETLTMVPWELEAVVPALLNERERRLLNAYHAEVYERISPHLSAEEREWLREATRPV